MSKALEDVAAERRRQLEAEGWTPEHDDEHESGDLAGAAVCYVMHHISGFVAGFWPWELRWFKPKERRRDLVRAAALIVAEIERLDRLEARAATGAPEGAG